MRAIDTRCKQQYISVSARRTELPLRCCMAYPKEAKATLGRVIRSGVEIIIVSGGEGGEGGVAPKALVIFGISMSFAS